MFIGGAVVQWLCDGLGIVKAAADVELLAASVQSAGDVRFVPAFVGLGAPYWDPYARGAIFGRLARNDGGPHRPGGCRVDRVPVVRSAAGDAARRPAAHRRMKVDGGASVNDDLMQFQADLLGVEVIQPVVSETTALGAAYLAGWAVGYWSDLDEIRRNWRRDKTFWARLDQGRRDVMHARWNEAVRRSLGWATPDG